MLKEMLYYGGAVMIMQHYANKEKCDQNKAYRICGKIDKLADKADLAEQKAELKGTLKAQLKAQKKLKKAERKAKKLKVKLSRCSEGHIENAREAYGL